MPDLQESEIYALIGEEGFARIVRAFYAAVPGDPVLGAMYPTDDLAGAEQRLADFLVMRFGGPSRYAETRGHPRLRMRHAPFAIDQNARDHWMRLMTAAVASAGIDADAAKVLLSYFDQSATFMVNRGST